MTVQLDQFMTAHVNKMASRKGVPTQSRFNFLTQCAVEGLDWDLLHQKYGLSEELIPKHYLYSEACAFIHFIGETSCGMYYTIKFEKAWVKVIVDSSLQVTWQVIENTDVYMGRGGYLI